MESNINIKLSKNIEIENTVIMIINCEFNSTTCRCSFNVDTYDLDKVNDNIEEIQKQIDNFKKMIKDTLETNNYKFIIF